MSNLFCEDGTLHYQQVQISNQHFSPPTADLVSVRGAQRWGEWQASGTEETGDSRGDGAAIHAHLRQDWSSTGCQTTTVTSQLSLIIREASQARLIVQLYCIVLKVVLGFGSLEELSHADQIKRTKMYGSLNPELNQNF